MATGRPQFVDLGRLAMILLPGTVGLLLRVRSAGSAPRWGWIALAPLVTIAVAAGALTASGAGGLLGMHEPALNIGGVASAAGVSALTSILEEWGWAGAGLALSTTAFGRRWGVGALGLIWAAWHLVPVVLRIGMFPDLEAGPPARVVAFIAACLVYRELLTRLQQRAGSWLGAAAPHAAPNALLAGLMAAGLGGFQSPADWRLYPAPGGLVFLALAAVAAGIVGMTSGRTSRT
jgi:hypothetical protein